MCAVSDEERREVARKLRDVTEEELRYVFLGEALNFAVGGRCLDDEGDIGEKLILNRLADLIEPAPERTCRYVWDEIQRAWKCSECGGLEPVCDDPKYCIDCGARVVDE